MTLIEADFILRKHGIRESQARHILLNVKEYPGSTVSIARIVVSAFDLYRKEQQDHELMREDIT